MAEWPMTAQPRALQGPKASGAGIAAGPTLAVLRFERHTTAMPGCESGGHPRHARSGIGAGPVACVPGERLLAAAVRGPTSRFSGSRCGTFGGSPWVPWRRSPRPSGGSEEPAVIARHTLPAVSVPSGGRSGSEDPGLPPGGPLAAVPSCEGAACPFRKRSSWCRLAEAKRITWCSVRSPAGGLPMTGLKHASAVRQVGFHAAPAGFPILPRGHCHRVDTLRFSELLQGLNPSEAGRSWRLDEGMLRPVCESHKRKMIELSKGRRPAVDKPGKWLFAQDSSPVREGRVTDPAAPAAAGAAR
jgi:hypothetical protein